MFGTGGQCAAEHRFVDEVDTEADGVTAGTAENVVSGLIFLLVAPNGEGRDDSGELIVPKGFEAGSGVKICAERKGQGEAEIGIAYFGVMKITGFESECARPVGREAILLSEQNVVVVGSGGGTGRRKSRLLDEVVLSVIAIEGGAEKPL